MQIVKQLKLKHAIAAALSPKTRNPAISGRAVSIKRSSRKTKTGSLA
jgi:hypothetical protein